MVEFLILFQLNEDLEGHIDFLAQTGPFSVPIRCVTKKCQVKNNNFSDMLVRYAATSIAVCNKALL